MKISDFSEGLGDWPTSYVFNPRRVSHNSLWQNENGQKVDTIIINWHLFMFAYNRWSQWISITDCRCCTWSSKDLLYIRMPTKYLTTNLFKKDWNTWFISHIKVFGAFNKLNGKTIHSNIPSQILKVVFHSSQILKVVFHSNSISWLIRNNWPEYEINGTFDFSLWR